MLAHKRASPWDRLPRTTSSQAIGETLTDLELKHYCNETLKRKADTLAVRKESFGTRCDQDFYIGWGQQYVKFIHKLSQ